MVFKEIKEWFLKSDHKEWFKTVEIEFYADPNKFQKTFIGVEQFYKFLLKEIENWNKIVEIESISVLQSSKDRINDLINETTMYLSRVSEGLYNTDRFDRRITSLISSHKDSLYLSNSPESLFLVELYKSNPNAIKGAHNFFIGHLNYSNWTSNRDDVYGTLAAYEFISSEFSQSFNRKKAEMKSFQKLRSEFDEQIDLVSSETDKRIEELDFIKETFSDDIGMIMSKKSDSFDLWFSETEIKHNELHIETETRFKDLESTYRDKLKLKEPATYWNTRSKELKTTSHNQMLVASLASLAGLIIIFIFAYSLSTDQIAKQIKNPAVSIRWSILSVVALALIIFIVRMFTKLAMSSYHLSRDAEERELLTFLYLSLKNETDIPDADRHIILQSLFSRSDTGILKDDSGPTMPSSVIEKFTSK